MRPLPYHRVRNSVEDRAEIERFKTDINLSEYAASLGYRIVRAERSAAGKWRGSTRSAVIMRNEATDDKIVVTRRPDGHWLYFNNSDHRDHGSIIDFIQRRRRLSLGVARMELRRWLGVERPVVPSAHFRPAADVAIQAKDRAAVQAALTAAPVIENHPYLNSRGIRPETLRDPRFRRQIRQDSRGNVLFPHHDLEGFCGWESKNKGWTSFAPGGTKGIWSSASVAADQMLVIVESGIDALSYHQLHRDPATRYASTAGTLGEAQRAVLAAEIRALPPSGTVVLAFDRDDGGERLAAAVAELAPGRPLQRQTPRIGKDWNDDLRQREGDYIRSITRSRTISGRGR